MAHVNSIYTVIKAPLLTEKSTGRLQSENKYAFWVDANSNRIQVKKAVQDIYKVKVERVNIMIIKGRTKRLRMGKVGKTVDWKKAVVTLKKGEQIKVV